jgi:hypothetical protein
MAKTVLPRPTARSDLAVRRARPAFVFAGYHLEHLGQMGAHRFARRQILRESISTGPPSTRGTPTSTGLTLWL